jgi:hypothetical protein
MSLVHLRAYISPILFELLRRSKIAGCIGEPRAVPTKVEERDVGELDAPLGAETDDIPIACCLAFRSRWIRCGGLPAALSGVCGPNKK